MDVIYRLQGIEFEWDAEKAQSNVANHGSTLEEAVEAFFDPFYQTGEASVAEEQRDFSLGYSTSQRLVLVVYTERHARMRIMKSPTCRAAGRSRAPCAHAHHFCSSGNAP